MNWQLYLSAFGALALGCAIRTLLPWLTTWLQTIADGNPPSKLKFEAKYIANFALAIIGYAVALAISEGAFSALTSLAFVPAVMVGYAGSSLAREALKLVPKMR